MDSIPILTIPISLVTPQTIIPVIEDLLASQPQVFIATPNPEQIMLAQRDVEFAGVLQSTDINIPDGVGVVWALRRHPSLKLRMAMEGQAVNRQLRITNYKLRNNKKKEQNNKPSFLLPNLSPKTYHLPHRGTTLPSVSRVTGIDLMLELCRWVAKSSKFQVPSPIHVFPSLLPPSPKATDGHGKGGQGEPDAKQSSQSGELMGSRWRIGLLGGAKEVNSQAVINLKSQFPNLDIVELSHYEYGKKDIEIIQSINNQKINMLFVALGAPKQELFISKYLKLMPSVRLAMGVGGAFDVIAGKLKRPPKFIQKIGLEWLYRLLQEPSRWRRQLQLIEFVYNCINNK